MRDTLLFDLDGTLVDTAPDLARATNEVIAQDGRPPMDYQEMRNHVGRGARHLIRMAYRAEVSDARIDQLFHDFIATYAAGIADNSVPFEGVVETLARLKRAGHELHVCTNKPGGLARDLIGKLGLTPLFGRIVGADDVPRNKPHSDHVFAAAGHRERERIVLVGDSATDSTAARNAKVASVLVTYGYSLDRPETLKADAIIGQFRELERVLPGL